METENQIEDASSFSLGNLKTMIADAMWRGHKVQEAAGISVWNISTQGFDYDFVIDENTRVVILEKKAGGATLARYSYSLNEEGCFEELKLHEDYSVDEDLVQLNYFYESLQKDAKETSEIVPFELVESPEENTSVYTLQNIQSLLGMVCHLSIKENKTENEVITWEIEPDVGLEKFQEENPERSGGLYESCGVNFNFVIDEREREVYLTVTDHGTALDTHYYQLSEEGRFVATHEPDCVLDESLEELNRFFALIRSDALGMNRHHIHRAIRWNKSLDKEGDITTSRWTIPRKVIVPQVDEV